jgi:Tol biopolymer transport system component
LRSLDSTVARPLAGTEGASYPFWSPDGRSVAFFADGKLKRTDIDGGYVQTLATATTGRGGTWNRDGLILFAPNNNNRPIYRIPASGGEPAAVTQLDAPRQTAHQFPQFLPDGNHFLFYAQRELPGVYLGQLSPSGPGQTRRLFDADTGAVYASSGELLFMRQGTLFAQDFDLNTSATTGDPVAISEQAGAGQRAQPAVAVSASTAGPIIYRTTPGSDRQSAWFDRSGKLIETIGNIDSSSDLDPALSPDGLRLAIARTVNANKDIWLLEIGRGVLSRFTFDPETEGRPVWSPDGNKIAFFSNRKGSFDLYERDAAGTGDEELLLESSTTKVPLDWSADGRFLLYRNDDPQTGSDLWALPLTGERKPFPVVQTPFQDRDGQFSPDTKWVAYQSNNSDRFEIYVQPFPGMGPRTQISSNGGIQARWRQDGRELFYVSLDDRLMAVPIKLNADAKSLQAGVPAPLFATHIAAPANRIVSSTSSRLTAGASS